MDSLKGKEAATVKRLLSATFDRHVEKYQTNAVTYRRRAVCVATTNEANYWQDPTGARRLVPVRVGDIRTEQIAQRKEHWLAEALHLYNSGESWWEFPQEIANEQEERQQIDPWEDILRAAMQGSGDRGGIEPETGVAVPWWGVGRHLILDERSAQLGARPTRRGKWDASGKRDAPSRLCTPTAWTWEGPTTGLACTGSALRGVQ
jgi:hypothetical protein